MIKIKNFLLLIAVLCGSNVFAQNAPASNVEMADGMMSSGKMYVVVAVVLIILAGLLLYLISIDRKVTKMERTIGAEKEQEKK
jgi:hypothetical protein